MIFRAFSSSSRQQAKKIVDKKPKYLGRLSNSLSAGVVGLANVGKSTFFQAITKSTLGNPANYPYATIDAEKAIVSVTSSKLEHLQSLYASEKKVPTSLTIYDIAGLTKNAASGQGLGNKFLLDIRQVDGIFHVVRGFRNDDITHIETTVDPVRDMTIVTDELILKDLDYIETALDLAKTKLRKPHIDKATVEFEIKVLEKLLDSLYDGRKVAAQTWLDEEIEVINSINLLTAKPTVVLLNVSAEDYVSSTNEFKSGVENWIAQNSPLDKLLLFSAAYEKSFNSMDTPKTPSAMAQAVHMIRLALHLISFYTCGPKEAHQWTVREGCTAPEAAGAIHTDLQRTFISANVYKWEDLEHEKAPLNETQLKSKGKLLRVGKTYLVEDGDVIVVKAAGGKN